LVKSALRHKLSSSPPWSDFTFVRTKDAHAALRIVRGRILQGACEVQVSFRCATGLGFNAPLCRTAACTAHKVPDALEPRWSLRPVSEAFPVNLRPGVHSDTSRSTVTYPNAMRFRTGRLRTAPLLMWVCRSESGKGKTVCPSKGCNLFVRRSPPGVHRATICNGP
jgi:hypothetical protein